MTRDEAIVLAKSEWWIGRDPIEVFWFQFNEPLLCMDFGAFHEAAEKSLGRPVFTHEFADPDRLRAEFLKERPAPSLVDILAMLPAEKTIVVVCDGELAS